MKTLHWEGTCEEFAWNELNPTDIGLARAARIATCSAYAPYSRFCVGAVVLLANGVTVCGSNQENASSPAGTCAERCALHQAQARFPEVPVTAMAIAARPMDNDRLTAEPVTPCGICRQVLAESEARGGQPIRLLLLGEEKVWILPCAGSLLPLPFRLDTPRGK